MQTRRNFLGTSLAVAAIPTQGWADAGKPTHLTAARTSSGAYAMIGLRADGSQAFQIPLPGRGHAAAAHPLRAEAVAFARRPGLFALVVDCAKGQVRRTLHAPDGHHFYGHGVYSRDGSTLFTSENLIATGEGRIGIWDASAGYARRGDMPSGGIGPHEIIRQPGTDALVVANGGIRTDPVRGRAKLNLGTMRPNLTLIDATGGILDVTTLAPSLHQNSLRHIAAFEDGRVAVAFQWQGDPFDAPSLVGLYSAGKGLDLLRMAPSALHQLDGYAGSIAVLDTHRFAVTYPRGGLLQVYDTQTEEVQDMHQHDVCGIAGHRDFGLATDGLGRVHHVGKTGARIVARHDVAFDNHLVHISS